MGIRKNIVISVMLHAMVVFSVVTAGTIFRDTALRAPEDYMMVSLFKEIAGLAVSDKQSKKIKKDKGSGVAGENSAPLPVIERNEVQGQSQQFDYDSKDRAALLPARNDNTFMTDAISGNNKENITGQSENRIPESYNGDSDKKGANSLYALIRFAIDRAKIYPLLARKKKIEGTVITDFFIDSNGRPQDIKIRKSSGYEILDSAAATIITKAAPFPKIDRHVVIPITFSLMNNSK